MPKAPAAKAASANVKKEQTETEELVKPEVEVPTTPKKRKDPSGGAEPSPSPTKKGKGGWSGEAKGKLATFSEFTPRQSTYRSLRQVLRLFCSLQCLTRAIRA